MIRVRRAAERGSSEKAGVRTRHALAFGPFQDPEWEAIGPLLAVNEEEFAPGAYLPPHSHRNVDILTFVEEGSFGERGADGKELRLEEGSGELLAAGSGLRHEEWNSSEGRARRLQFWLAPRKRGEEPSRQSFSSNEERIAVPNGATVKRLGGRAPGSLLEEKAYGRFFWVQVLKGRATVLRHELEAGDAAAISAVSALRLSWSRGSEILVLDLTA